MIALLANLFTENSKLTKIRQRTIQPTFNKLETDGFSQRLMLKASVGNCGNLCS